MVFKNDGGIFSSKRPKKRTPLIYVLATELADWWCESSLVGSVARKGNFVAKKQYGIVCTVGNV